jgi:hypothetical protein
MADPAQRAVEHIQVSPGQLSFGMGVMVALPALKPGAWLLELPDIQAARLKRWTVLSA